MLIKKTQIVFSKNNEKVGYKNYKFKNFPSIGKNYNKKLLYQYLFEINQDQLLTEIKLNDLFKDQYLEKVISLSNMQKVRNYKYFRLKKHLPIRGQRTHTNAKTRKKHRVK